MKKAFYLKIATIVTAVIVLVSVMIMPAFPFAIAKSHEQIATVNLKASGNDYELPFIPVETNHVWDNGTVTTPPTCTQPGVKTYICKLNLNHTKTEEIPATGHIPAETVRENEVVATCTEDGSYEEVVYCSVCQAEISREAKTIPAAGHTQAVAVIENKVFSTCSATGSYDEVVYCSVCHEEVSREQKIIPIDEGAHDFGEWIQTKAPTETEPGEETRTCKNNPSHTETREIPALGPLQVELSFLDDEVIIVVPRGAIPEGSEFNVKKIVPPPAEVVEKVKDQMGSSSEVLAYYEIRLFKTNGTLIIHLDGAITIKTKMPEQYVGNKCLRILQEDETGKLIVMESWWEVEYLCYKTDWLEIYN